MALRASPNLNGTVILPKNRGRGALKSEKRSNELTDWAVAQDRSVKERKNLKKPPRNLKIWKISLDDVGKLY
jgi:hypothetical protein